MTPKLTVLVPTLNRPEFAKVAVDSVLGQEGGYCCEIVVSNNGANSQTREIFSSETYKNKIVYIETNEILPMPVHWEWASGFATGEYLMVLPDRRLLKQGAVRQLISSMDNNLDCEACCCCDDWLYESGRVMANATFISDTKLAAEKILQKFENGIVDRNTLPLGLNCVLRSEFLADYRNRYGKYFNSISPDFRSAFNFLFTANNVYIIAEPLMMTTGFRLSNGGKAYMGDRSYLESLGPSGEFNFMPQSFDGNVWGTIYEDYLRSRYAFKGDGDYKTIMSKPAMSFIIIEETIKVVACRFNRNSLNRYRGIRRVLKTCGWDFVDDLKAIKGVFSGLKQLLPEPIKRVYRYLYNLNNNNNKKDVLRVAGF